MKHRKRKKKIRFKPRFFVLVMLILALTFLIGSRTVNFIKDAMVETEYSYEGEIDDSLSLEAMLFKDEKVVYATFTGKARRAVAEGEKVRKETKVVELLDQEAEQEYNFKLSNLSKEIIKKEKELEKQRLDLNQMIIAADEKAKEIALKIESEKRSGSDNISTLEKELNHYLNVSKETKEKLFKLDATLSNNIKDLKEEKKRLEETFAASKVGIPAPNDGVVSYFIDGYEKNWDNEFFLKLGLDEYNRVENILTPTFQDEEIIKAGEPIFKIVNNSKSRFIIPVPEEISEKIKPNESLHLEFINMGNTAIKGTVIGFGKSDGHLQLILIESSQWLDDFSFLRKTPVKVVFQKYHGTIVPLTAVTEVNGKTGVYYIYKGKVYFKEVEVIGANGQKAAVKGISPNTEIVVNPQSVEVGQIVL